MKEKSYAVVLVYTTNYALRAEKVLAEQKIPSKLIPVPRHLSSDCGVCVRINQEDMERAREAFVENEVVFEDFYPLG